MTKVKEICRRCHQEFSTFALTHVDIPGEQAKVLTEVKEHFKSVHKRVMV